MAVTHHNSRWDTDMDILRTLPKVGTIPGCSGEIMGWELRGLQRWVSVVVCLVALCWLEQWMTGVTMTVVGLAATTWVAVTLAVTSSS